MKTKRTINKKAFLESAEQLEECSQAYFKSIDAINKEADRQKPYSQTGLAKYLWISYPSWISAKEGFQEHPDFNDVLRGIEIRINTNQLTGALIGIFPACILNETFWKKHEERELRFNQ
jgi:hypothetical protein